MNPRIATHIHIPTFISIVEIIPPSILIDAYSQGIFPMVNDGQLEWFSPEQRGIIPLDDGFHIPHGLKKALRRAPFTLRRDSAFAATMEGCADRPETWIDPLIHASYCHLHELGHAHSIECWDEDGLQGGLYGVKIGRAFFGESMFSRKTDASKIALVHLVDWLRAEDAILLDTQWMTPHLRTLGGTEIPRKDYLKRLKEAVTPH